MNAHLYHNENVAKMGIVADISFYVFTDDHLRRRENLHLHHLRGIRRR
jgi:hypothetical protein